MILSDRDILERIKRRDLVIEPLDKEVQIGPSSVDLRLGNKFRVFKLSDHALIDPKNYSDRRIHELCLNSNTRIYEHEFTRLYASDKPFILHPGEFVLASLLEKVKLPRDLVGSLEGRSSLGRVGLMVHSTAGVVAPGFEGTLTLELANVGKLPIKLYPGMRICQIVFQELKSPAMTSYGERGDSKYQNQDGANESRIGSDKELRGN